jgi:hypothetical protein
MSVIQTGLKIMAITGRRKTVLRIDLYNDSAMNKVSNEERKLYMKDDVHPTRAGYKLGWPPLFEKYLYNLLGQG